MFYLKTIKGKKVFRRKRKKMTIGQMIEYRQRLLDFRSSSDIQNVTYEWRVKLNDEIERLDNEINPPTIEDYKA